jgi:hypothetical protein
VVSINYVIMCILGVMLHALHPTGLRLAEVLHARLNKKACVGMCVDFGLGTRASVL